MQGVLDGITLLDFANFDNEVNVTAPSDPVQSPEVDSDVRDEPIESDEEDSEMPIDSKTAFFYYKELMTFAISQQNISMIDSLVNVGNHLYSSKIANAKQTKIDDFFNKK